MFFSEKIGKWLHMFDFETTWNIRSKFLQMYISKWMQNTVIMMTACIYWQILVLANYKVENRFEKLCEIAIFYRTNSKQRTKYL